MRDAVENASQVSRRKVSMAPPPASAVLSTRKRSPAAATSGAMRYSGRGSSRAPDAKKARSASSVQATARSTRSGRCASRISAETLRRSSRARDESANRALRRA